MDFGISPCFAANKESIYVFIRSYIISIFWYFFYKSFKKKTFKLLIISFLSIFIIHNSLVILNEYKNKEILKEENVSSNNHGVFFTFIDAIYISTSEDSELFKNQKLRETVYLIFKEMEKKKH